MDSSKTAFNKLVQARHGHLLYNQHDQYIGRSVALYGEYSEAEVSLYRQICKPGDVIVEVGANIGIHTLPLARLVGERGHVYAFEPQRLVFQTLCANVAINSLSNVTCLPYGVAEKNQDVSVREVDYKQAANFGGISLEAVQVCHSRYNEGDQSISAGSEFSVSQSSGQESSTSLKLVSLDESIPDVPVKLLKIDVEGMESQVVSGSEGLIKKHQPIIYIENDRQEKSKALIEQLWELGYVLYWYMPRLYNPDNFNNNKTNVFGNILSVNMVCVPDGSVITIKDFLKVENSDYHPMRR